MDFHLEGLENEQRIDINASIKRICSTDFQTQMSDTSSEPNYSPLSLSPAPSEVLKEDPYEACSDEEDNDEEDTSMKFPEMGATWEPVVHALAGSSHQELCDRIEDWADEKGYILSRSGDKSKGQAYFYCHKVGRQKQHNRNAAQSGVLPEDSRTVPTYAPESKADCCPFNVYISRRMNGMREVWSVSPKGLRLDHNHPPQTARQKKFLGPVNLSREDADLIIAKASKTRGALPKPTPSSCHLTQTTPKHASIHIWARNGPLLRPQRREARSHTPLQARVT